MIVILAHGTLGWYDELIFLGIVVIFLGMMFVSWFRSRSSDYDKTDLMPEATKPDPTNTDSPEERYKLE